MDKTLLMNDEQFEFWLNERGGEGEVEQVDGKAYKPIAYPCVVTWCVQYKDDDDAYTVYDFVYMTDFVDSAR